MPFGRIAFANRILETAWARGWAERPSLDPADLVAKAQRRGRTDFGPREIWWPNLELLAASLEDEARLNPLGRVIAQGQLVSSLRNRAAAYKLWREHPEILRSPLPRPIIVLGQMRSGTTRLQRLLACDPALVATRFYEGFNPLPRTRRGLGDDRIVRTAIGLAAAHLCNPGFRAIHPTSVFAADEEIGLQSFSLFGSAFEVQWRIPTFARTLETIDTRAFYQEFAALVGTLGVLRQGRGGRRPILKLPQFTQDIDALLRIFPDADLIRIERDPLTVIASSASLVENQMRIQSDDVDPLWIGGEWTHKFALRETRTRDALKRSGVRWLTVSNSQIDADWRRTMRTIYAFLGLPFRDAAANQMAEAMMRDRDGGHHAHRYSPERYGLPPAAGHPSERLRLNTARKH